MHLLIDNALSPRLAALLRDRGFESTHVREIGLQNAADEVIFEHAERFQHTIVSADTDFGAILAHRQAAMPSVILFRCSNKRTEYIFELLSHQIERFITDLENGCVLVFDDRRVRIRNLPIIKK